MPVLGTGVPNLTHLGISSFCHAIVGASAENAARRPPSQLLVSFVHNRETLSQIEHLYIFSPCRLAPAISPGASSVADYQFAVATCERNQAVDPRKFHPAQSARRL